MFGYLNLRFSTTRFARGEVYIIEIILIIDFFNARLGFGTD
ncbi:Uncharacterized protein YR821_2141 [Yersinia ruckeri]|nr:Uncharacterized protein YR821_2141 [Yersinia ruckeri]